MQRTNSRKKYNWLIKLTKIISNKFVFVLPMSATTLETLNNFAHTN